MTSPDVRRGRWDVYSNAKALRNSGKGKGVDSVIPYTLSDEDDDDVLGEAWVIRAKPELEASALHGPIGEVVSVCAPECEGSPVSILLPALTIYGCMMGRRVYQDIGGTYHYSNLFGLIVGDSGDSRKGTGNGVATRAMSMVDAQFVAENIAGGLSSGEGLIARIADARAEDGEMPPPRDTRLHISEEEAGSVFTRMKRDGNSLSPVLRQAWDSRTLSTITRRDEGGLIAKDPVVSAIMMITPDELRHGLSDIETVNGFLNRFAMAYAERVAMLPFGRPVDAERLRPPVIHLQNALHGLPTMGALELGWTAGAREMYEFEIYPNIKPLPGRLAAMTARGAPIIRRLAGIYCVSRGDTDLSIEDLTAATAIWNYSIETVQYVYGGSVFSALAQRMISALEAAGENGLTLTALRDAVSSGHKTAKPQWDAAVRELQFSRQVSAVREKTTGRTVTRLSIAAYKRGNKGKEESTGKDEPLLTHLSTALNKNGKLPETVPTDVAVGVDNRPRGRAII